jgi:acyl-CoA thioesterase I
MKNILYVLVFVMIAALFIQGCDSQSESSTKEAATTQKPETQRQEPQTQKLQRQIIVALGDSLTAGYGVELDDSYPALLEEKLVAEGYHFRVVNAGVSGETSSGTLSRLDWILSQKPDIVILEIGANDGLRGIDTTLVEANIDTILQRLRDNNIITVLAGMKMVRNLGDQYTRDFDAIYPKLASKHKVTFMPFFLEDVASIASLNSGDGIHPNEQGYKIIVENIYPYVVRAIEQLRKNSAKNG